jgi:hypothetical protein
VSAGTVAMWWLATLHGTRAVRPRRSSTFSTHPLPGRRLGWEIEQLADELSELFGHRVDLVSLRSLHPLLRPSVLAGARPVYAA